MSPLVNMPIWVTDPAGNNNPFLKIRLSTVFAAGQSAIYGNGLDHPPTVSGNIYYSKDGLNWNIATTNISSLSGLDIQQLFCFQGEFTAQYAFTARAAGPFIQGFGWLTSTDGVNWTKVCQVSDGTSINMSYNSTTNQFTYTANSPPQPGLPVTVNNPFPPPPTFNNNDFDPLNGKPLADPAQASNATIPPSQISQNPLPSGFTAVRDNSPPLQYTKDTITNAIVNSGFNWPAANWTSISSYSSVVLGTNSNDPTIFYAGIAPQ